MIQTLQALGALIAILFVGTLTATLWWMLHPPAIIPAAAAKARQGFFAVKRLLVPTIGLPYTERGVELACRLGDDQGAEVLLLYVMEVPRTLPLGIALPDVEEKARVALERAASIVTLHQTMSVEKIVQRARVAGEEIAKIAKDRDVDMIVLGIEKEEMGFRSGTAFSKTADAILRHAPCEVVIDQSPKGG
jgi:nucleotide-binding universal stress UspA family protein